MKTFTTPNGKDIAMYYEGFSIRIKFVGGGELPECLAGKYTTEVFAEIDILKYLASLEDRKTKTKE